LNSDLEKKKSKKNNGSSKAGWIYRVFILAFGLSVFFSFISEVLLTRVSIFTSLFILLVIIAIGVVFDIIGIAVTSAGEAPFHAMAADKIPGGKEAVKLIRNADIVSNFCNDVVGDISGIISGAAGAAIIIKTVIYTRGTSEIVLSILLTAIISTLTIGGKAIGKGIAINNSKAVVYSVALFLNTLKNHLNIEILPGNSVNKGTNRREKQ
jgi:CBS domain containing-hemolysin-like protein